MPTDAISASLRSLQSQFTAFQEDLGGVKSDIKDALSQLQALRTVLNKTDGSIAELECVIGVSSSTRSRGRGKRGRARGGRNTNTPSEGDNAGTVPEKTLIQTVALIQSAIETLLPRDSRASHLHSSLSPVPPSATSCVGRPSFHVSALSSRPSVTDPSREPPTMQSMQFTFPVSSVLQSGPSSPVSPIPTSEFGASLPPSINPAKEYAEASIQACCTPTSEPPCSLSNSHGHTPGFVPVDWSINPVRPTTVTADYLARFLRDANLRAPSTTMDSQTPQNHLFRNSAVSAPQMATGATSASMLSPYSYEPITGARRADLAVLFTAASSSDTSTLPSVGGTTPAAAAIPFSPPSVSSQNTESILLPVDRVDSLVIPPGDSQMSLTSPLGSSSNTSDIQSPLFPANRLSQGPEQLQASLVATEGVDSSMKPPRTRPPAVSRRSSTSPLSSLSSTRDTSISAAGTLRNDHLARSHGKSDLEDAQMKSDVEGDAISALGDSTPPSPHRQQSPMAEADNEELPSGLPTPPSETMIDLEPRAVSRSMRELGAVQHPRPTLCTQLSVNFPVIPTPPFWTPEPTVGGDLGMAPGIGRVSTLQGSLGTVSELPLPLTPPLFSPSSAVARSPAEENAKDANKETDIHGVVEEHTDSPDDAAMAVNVGNAAGGVNVGAPMDELSPGIDQAGAEVSTCTTPVITITDESQTTTVSDEPSSQAPDVARDLDLSGTPASSVNQQSAEFPVHDPNVTVRDTDPTYSPPHAFCIGYDFHFSSPCHDHSSLTSTTPSRYATPSESSDVRQVHVQDENEVWHALMLGESGESTPLSGVAPSLSMLFSHPPSRAVSVHPDVDADAAARTIDRSVLQLLQAVNSPMMSVGSLSSLTSLSDVDKEVVDSARVDKTLHATESTTKSSGRGHNSATNTVATSRDTHEGRCSEPYRAPPSRSISRALSTAMSASTSGRAASEATGMSRVGGPGASLEELAMLSRKAPLKIMLRVPDGMRGMKRKRDVDNDDGHDGEGKGDNVAKGPLVGAKGENGDTATNGEREGWGNGDMVPAGPVGQVERRDGMSSEAVPPTLTEVEISTPGVSAPTPTVPPLIPDSTGKQPNMTSDPAPSHITTQKDGERRRKKRKRVLKANPEPSVTYHVRKGQIVCVASDQEPQPPTSSTTPVMPSTPGLEEAHKDSDVRSLTRSRRRKKQENQAMKTPPSPAYPSSSSARHARHVKSSPSKEDVWKAITRRAGTWPELPSVFSPWDVQFIQCDNCDMWYHYGCVAIQSGDPRLDASALFICPTCHNQSARRQTLRNHSDTCARPDCPEPQVTAESEIYFVEKLVGRKKSEGYMYMWLAKWEGYPMTQATWIPKENVVGDGTRMMNAFLEEAIEEGADLSLDVVLLQEARDAGWDTLAC